MSKKLLADWIRQGAPWEEHWAFKVPQPPRIPKLNTKGWVRTTVDPFVLSQLEAESISPAKDDSPARWLRRVTLDLTGLPPTSAERQTFLETFDAAVNDDETDQLFMETVDRLLASPAYGERWASVWLDQIRYADSKGLGSDGRRNIWKYRDWVIDALNRDMPYDQFTIKQLAGDLVPEPTIGDRIATAAHRLTQTNEEGGTDDEEFRIAAVLDRVNTTWQAWQGVTFGCAQCHSHPYEPIEHDEYYKFAAFFNNTADTDLGEEHPKIKVPPGHRENTTGQGVLDNEIAKLNRKIWQSEFAILQDESDWQPVTKLSAKTNNKTKMAVSNEGEYSEFSTVGTVSSGTDLQLRFAPPSDLERITAIKLTILPI